MTSRLCLFLLALGLVWGGTLDAPVHAQSVTFGSRGIYYNAYGQGGYGGYGRGYGGYGGYGGGYRGYGGGYNGGLPGRYSRPGYGYAPNRVYNGYGNSIYYQQYSRPSYHPYGYGGYSTYGW